MVQGGACNGGSGTQCDEYPFASTLEGGQFNSVSLRSVNGSQNAGAGAQLGWFYTKCNIPKNDPSKKYKVISMRGLPQTGFVCAR